MKHTVDAQAIQETVSALVDGLQTDGAHHKQYFIELAIERLVGSLFAEKLKEKFPWEEGRAP